MAPETPAYFTPQTFRFLDELAKNNNRPWFAENKARYEELVQAPAVRFIRDAGPKLKKLSSHLVADARPFGGSLSRIYRDTRFSKDKSPYHSQLGIHFSYKAGLGRAPGLPGYYLHLAPGETFAASGVWHPEPPALKKVRDAIVERPASWKKVLDARLDLEGESVVRVPPGLNPGHPYVRDLRRKDFIASIGFKDPDVAQEGFLEAFAAACKRMDPLNRFLATALGLPW